MGYGKRIDTLCSLLIPGDTFADVGCDHGYCTEYMLKNGFCKKAIFSDISRGSLAKAEELLDNYVKQGKAVGVLGNGFFGVPKDVDQVLIAGMGGSEIVEIVSDKNYGFIPKRFVFQPMRDAEKLRRYILEHGGYIDRDFTFRDGKFYDVITGGADGKNHEAAAYSDLDYEFGKENVTTKPHAFVERLQKLAKDIDGYLEEPNVSEGSKTELLQRKQRLLEALK